MKKIVFFLLTSILLSCSKDEFANKKTNPLDPSSDEIVLVVDSVKSFEYAGYKNALLYYTIKKNLLPVPERAKYFDVYRNNVKVETWLVPTQTTSSQLYIYDPLAAGTYSYKICLWEFEDHDLSIFSNEKVLVIP